MINLIKSIALLTGLEGGEFLRAAGGVVEQDIGQLVDGHAGSVVEYILRIASSAASISIEGLAERVDGITNSIVDGIALVAWSTGSVLIVGVAVIINGHTGLVSIEEPSLGAGKAHLVLPVPAGTTDISGVGIVELGEETSSVLEVVSREAGQAVTLGISRGALVGNRSADLVGVEEPSLGAGKALLVVPIPGSASGVRGLGVIGGREDASTILKVVSLEAGKASASAIRRSTLIGDGGADLVGVEDPVLGAGETDLIVPIPGGTSGISGLGVVRRREYTGSVLKIISLEAGQAGSLVVVGSTLIGNGHTDIVSIENPVLWAGKALLTVPVPGGTARVSGLGIVERWENTGTILKVVSLEAGKASASAIRRSTLIGDGHADTVGVEDPIPWTGKTFLVVPVPSSASGVRGLGVVGLREYTGSVLKIVSLEAWGTGSLVVVGSTLIGNGHTDIVSIENPVLWASKALLVIPIPGGTARVSGLGIVGSREDASTILKVVSLEAGKASASAIRRSTLIGDGHADTVGVEDPIPWTGKTFLVVPVPSSASGVRRLSIVGGREDAGSILDIIALVASKAVTLVVVGSTLIRDRHADVVLVEDPSEWAWQALLVVPVPGSATWVSGLSIVGVGENALSVLKVISLEAGKTGTSAVRWSTLIRNGHADLVSIENPVLWAGKADLTVPVPSSASGVSGLGIVVRREDTDTILKVVSLEAWGTGSLVIMGGTEVGNRGADTVTVENPVLWAGETLLVVPVPGGASRVRGASLVELGEEASSVLKIVSLEAGQAVSSTVGRCALVRDGHAGTIGIGEPSLGAGKAFLVVPIPGSASGISRLGIVGGGEDTSSLLKVVSLEAGKAGTSAIRRSTLIGDGGADVVGVENPSVGAGKTFLVVPVPSSASGVSGLGVVGVGVEALSVLEIISLIAWGTVSTLVVGGTLVSNRHADFVLVESPSLRARETDLVLPVPISAAEIGRVSSVGRWVDTGSIDDIISTEAGEAGTGGLIECVALCADWSADSVLVEVGPIGTLSAGLTLPDLAKQVAIGHNRDIIVLHTGSRADNVAVVALSAGTSLLPWWAEIGDGGANLLGIEEPSLGALGADSVVPEGASDISSGGLVDLGALTIDDGIPLVALLADTFLNVELLAGALHLTADSVFIEEETLRTLQAGGLTPHLAAEVVVELGQQGGVLELFLGQLQVLCKGLSHQEEQNYQQGCF
jgi:hypothetical protein